MPELVTILAAEGGGGEGGGGGGSFLVSPSLGLMIWTLLAFGAAAWVLARFAFPRIASNLDRRQRAIEESIDVAEHTKQEAEQLLAEYRERLGEARRQAEEIVDRARKAGEAHEAESLSKARQQREELMAQTRRDIEAETRRAIQEIRSEVADLTVMATEKVLRRSLDDDDQRRLVEEAIGELDFSQLSREPQRG